PGVVAGQSDLGGADEVRVVGEQDVDLVGVLAEEAGTGHDLRLDQGGGAHRGESSRERLVNGRVQQRELEAGTDAGEVVEPGTGDLRAALGVDGAEPLAQVQVVGGEIGRAHV